MNSWFCSRDIHITIFIISLLLWFFLYAHVESKEKVDDKSSLFGFEVDYTDGLNLTKFPEYVDNMSIFLGIVFCLVFELMNSWVCKQI